MIAVTTDSRDSPVKPLRLAAILLLTLSGAAAADRAGGVVDRSLSRETKDRVSGAELHQMVAGPLRMFAAGDLAGGAAAFEAELAVSHGPGRRLAVERADELTAMGVELFNLANARVDDSTAAALRRAGLAYLRRAIPATRTAFGEDDPELALAMTDYVDAELELEPGRPAVDVDALAARAYAIRLARLGPDNPETLSSMIERARIEGMPSRTEGDPARVQAAIARLERVRVTQVRRPQAQTRDALAPLVREAEILLANGRPREAAETFDRAGAAAASLPGMTESERYAFALTADRFADHLKDRDPAVARRIRNQYAFGLGAPIANLSGR